MGTGKPSLKYGLIMGLIGVALILLVWVASPETLYSAEWRFGKIVVYALAMPLLMLILGARDARDAAQSFNYSKAFMAAFGVGVVAVLVLFAFNMLFYNVLEPEFYKNSYETVMESLKENLDAVVKQSSMSSEEAQIYVEERILESQENYKFVYSNLGTVFSAMLQMMWYGVLSLLIAIVFKDKK